MDKNRDPQEKDTDMNSEDDDVDNNESKEEEEDDDNDEQNNHTTVSQKGIGDSFFHVETRSW